MTKRIELTLIKSNSGIIVANEDEGKIDYFDQTEEARKDFVKYMIEEFINREVE